MSATTPDASVSTVSAAPAPETSQPEPTLESVLGPERTYRAEIATYDNYKFTADVVLHDAIADTSGASLTAAWSEVGGVGEVPCVDTRPDSAMTDFMAKSAAYAFGTFTLHNEGPTAPSQLMVNLFEPNLGIADSIALGVGYAGATRCEGLATLGSNINPALEANQQTWGPVPIVIAFADANASPLTGSNGLVLGNGLMTTLRNAAGNKVDGIEVNLATSK